MFLKSPEISIHRGECHADAVLQYSFPILSEQVSGVLELSPLLLPANLHLRILNNSQ